MLVFARMIMLTKCKYRTLTTYDVDIYYNAWNVVWYKLEFYVKCLDVYIYTQHFLLHHTGNEEDYRCPSRETGLFYVDMQKFEKTFCHSLFF